MHEPFLGRKFQLQLLLPDHRRHRSIDAQHLVIARDHLARGARLAVVEQDEIFDYVEEALVGQHAIQQHLGFHTALVRLVLPLPFGEVLPLAGDGAIFRTVAVRDDQKGVVVEGVGDDILVHVVG